MTVLKRRLYTPAGEWLDFLCVPIVSLAFLHHRLHVSIAYGAVRCGTVRNSAAARRADQKSKQLPNYQYIVLNRIKACRLYQRKVSNKYYNIITRY